MQCSEISELMMKYLDKDISELELIALEKHNISCKSCNHEFNALKKAVGLVETLPDVEPPYAFEMKVMRKIGAETYKRNTANLLVGIGGLFSFAYYMLLFVIIPYVQNTGILDNLFGYGSYGLEMFMGYLTNILVYIPIAIENLIKLRNILIRDYMNWMLVLTGIVMVLNLGLIKVLSLQQE